MKRTTIRKVLIGLFLIASYAAGALTAWTLCKWIVEDIVLIWRYAFRPLLGP